MRVAVGYRYGQEQSDIDWLTERIHWLLIAEAFNVANRYEITSVNTTQYQFSGTTLYPQSSFGTRSASGTNLFGARQIQLGTRITF